MKQCIYLGGILVLSAILPAEAADPRSGEVRKVEVFPAHSEVRVEVTLSAPVVPSVEVAQHPDRLVLKLPGTVSDAQQKRILVRQLGVRSVRFGLNHPNPPETHLVVDLDQEHPYKILTNGTKITLVVETPRSVSAERRTGPAAPASGPLLGYLGRRQDSGRGGGQSNQEGVWLTPPASVAENSSPQVVKTSESNVSTPVAQTATEHSNPAASQTPKASEAPVENVAEESSPGSDGSREGRVLLPSRAGENPDLRTAFRVKYVAQDAAYLDGGRAAGLAEGMKLVVRDLPNSGAVAAEGADSAAAGDVAELEVLSVAETSSVTEIRSPKRPVKVGDLAYLSSADQQTLVEKNALSATRKYPAVVSFTENDTLDDEARAEVPKPPLPSVNRARGRIGFDYIGVVSHDGSGMQSSNLGMVLRADITRINGTHWNVSGYWRGRFNSTSAGPQTLQDLINRTYHLYTTYDNPSSSWVAGFGRMYLPWAPSLDTIDGGYFGRKLGRGVTAGLFLGSTPDPTSYSYAPNREIGGAFVNFEGGSYDNFRYTSTSGGGLKMLKWSPNRPFLFFENGVFYKRVFSIYQSAQIDSQAGYDYQNPNRTTAHQAVTGFGLGRSFTTIRIQPHPRVEFSFNHTYFRDLPTFDPNLIQTGLLDKYLMQGFSAGTASRSTSRSGSAPTWDSVIGPATK